MTAAELTQHWQEQYGVEPRPSDLRNFLPDRWLRIHSLPEMKRYPESPDEFAIVLHRHNEVLSALLTPGQEAILITPGYSEKLNPAPHQDPDLHDSFAWHWTTIQVEPEDPESWYCHLFARAIIWQPGILDDLLRLVAMDKVRDVLVIGVNQGIAYHPYDGGGDLIVRDRQQRDQLKVRFAEWLSPLASGL